MSPLADRVLQRMRNHGRKGPKRVVKVHGKSVPNEDSDLMTLARALDEHRLDHNASGWFKLPWRDGWNAVGLAFEAGLLDDRFVSGSKAESWLKEIIGDHSEAQSVDGYQIAGELIGDPFTNRFHSRALRCLQVVIANSGGDGTPYNDILTQAFSGALPEKYAGIVMEHRCRDAIGVSPSLNGDVNDRLRRAFQIAWDRGLFLAAYALKSAV